MPLIAFAIVILLILWGFMVYNDLVRKRNRTENAWAQVDVQLKRRADLVPNVVETVKGFASHEQGTLEAVINARNAALGATGVAEQQGAENMLTGALKNLFALSEAYPDLTSSANFRSLQAELSETEGKIAIARQIFNDTTLTYNNAVDTFPSKLIAGPAGFDTLAYFQTDDDGRSAPEVQF